MKVHTSPAYSRILTPIDKPEARLADHARQRDAAASHSKPLVGYLSVTDQAAGQQLFDAVASPDARYLTPENNNVEATGPSETLQTAWYGEARINRLEVPEI
jgi:hypothetical protein